MWISSSLLFLEELVCGKQDQPWSQMTIHQDLASYPSFRACTSMLTVALWVQFPHLENEEFSYLPCIIFQQVQKPIMPKKTPSMV